MTQAVVTLVPFRGGDERREWCWDVTRPALDALGHPVYTGAPRGDAWSRSQACNAASEAAGDWEVALVADCDTIPDPESINRAITWVLQTRGGARPHMERWMTTQEGALVLAQRGPRHLNYSKKQKPKHIGQLYRGGGLLVVHRQAWETVGGYDEEFIGWGYEDTAMNLALLTQAQWHRLPGESWHLWHSAKDNHPRKETVERYRSLLKEHQWAIDRWAGNQGLMRPQEVF